MKKILIAAGIILALCALFGSCSDSSSDTEYSRYSSTYRNDAEYRENVGDIADAYGISEEEVDRKINAITGGR